MNLHTKMSELGIQFSLHRVILSLLLSLLLVRMYAQNPEPLAPCSSWHLVLFQAVGDEVKGIYPLAYDDVPTEASVCYFCPFCVLLPLFSSQAGQCPTLS